MPRTSASPPSKTRRSQQEAAGGLPLDMPNMDNESLAEQLVLHESQSIALEERIAELEFELEDVGWLRENERGRFEFEARNLLRIIHWARLMYLKNPLIGHGVEVKADYVFAQGLNIKVADEDQAALEAFMFHPKNVVELTTTEAMWLKECRLQVDGNIFFALFIQGKNKPVVVRTIPVEEIVDQGDIVFNPQDRKEPWYYRRVWTAEELNLATGEVTKKKRTDYYPDWRYNPKTKPASIGRDNHPVHWDTPVLHVKVGALDEMRYGIPEVYRALPWARATVRDLEDYASIKRALARFAWKAELKGGRPAITALRNKLQTSVSVAEPVEHNPPPAPGSTWAGNTGYDMTPMRTAGAQPDSDAGRQIRVMAGTGLGLPDTILSGDASAGALATAKTLDRPTELKMLKRQAMWSRILQNLLAFNSAKYRGIALPADGPVTFSEAATDAAILKAINVDFPPILERDAAGRVDAVIAAATLDGKSKAGTMTDKNLVMLLLQALGLDDDIDVYMAKLKFDEDDMLPKQEVPPGLSPGGPTPGPDPGAPPDRQAQNLDKQEPAATPSEIMARRNRESTVGDDISQQLRLLREAIEAGQSVEEALAYQPEEEPVN